MATFRPSNVMRSALIAAVLAVQISPALATPVRTIIVPTATTTTLDIPQLRPNAPYLGSVRTMPGTYGFSGVLAYDPDHVGLFLAAGNVVYKVSLAGIAQPLGSLPEPPVGITWDRINQTLYATDGYNHSVDAFDPKNGSTTVIAGGSYGTNDGQGSAAQFQGPQAIALDGATQTLYVADVDRVRVVTTSGLVTTLTAPGSIGGSQFCGGPFGIGVDHASGNLYLSDTCRNVIHTIGMTSGAVTDIAGQCVTIPGYQCAPLQRDGKGSRALFASPVGTAFGTADGRVYIADAANNQIRVMTRSGAVATLAGGGPAGFNDGVGARALFSSPNSIALAPSAGKLYIFDAGNQAIRIVSITGAPPPPPQHGIALYDPPTAASQPYGIAATADGSIWFSESAAQKIGRLRPGGPIVEYALPSGTSPFRMATGADGNVWFAAGIVSNFSNTGGIGRIRPDGHVTVFQLPQFSQANQPFADDLVSGPDGNVWFVDEHSAALGYITPQGKISAYEENVSQVIAGGFTNDAWTGNGFYASGLNDYASDGRLIKAYEFGSVYATAITRGPRAHMWFAGGSLVGEVRPHEILLHPLPSLPCCPQWQPFDMTMGGDGALWMTMDEGSPAGYLARFTISNTFSAHIIPAPRSGPTTIVAAPDGTIWFADPGADKIGRWY